MSLVKDGIEMDVEKELRRIARELLKRPPTRRGPYILDEAELRRVAGYART